jgi:hypothetical protein
MNGEDLHAQAKAEARFKDQQLAHTIAFDLIDMVKTKHPHSPPRVVYAALASAIASLLVLCAKGDAEALAGTEITYRELRRNVIGMLATKRERDGQAAKTHS